MLLQIFGVKGDRSVTGDGKEKEGKGERVGVRFGRELIKSSARNCRREVRRPQDISEWKEVSNSAEISCRRTRNYADKDYFGLLI
jgi:hypothetical protein